MRFLLVHVGISWRQSMRILDTEVHGIVLSIRRIKMDATYFLFVFLYYIQVLKVQQVPLHMKITTSQKQYYLYGTNLVLIRICLLHEIKSAIYLRNVIFIFIVAESSLSVKSSQVTWYSFWKPGVTPTIEMQLNSFTFLNFDICLNRNLTSDQKRFPCPENPNV